MTEENVSQQELNKFAELASSWWDKTGPCQPLHEINPIRLNFITNQLKLANKKVLDVGCGGGILTESMAKQGAIATGIDLNPEVIEVAKLHLYESELSIDYQLLDVTKLAEQQPHSFDVVTCMELLEHVPQPEEIIKACAKLLKPGGHAFFSTINRNLKAYLFAILGAEYLLNMLPKGTHDYDKFLKPSEIDHWARQAKLELKQLKGMNYNPIAKTYKLCDDVNVNYLMHYQLENL